MEIINLTPHEVVILAGDKKTVLSTVSPSGQIARCSVTSQVAGEIAGIPVYRNKLGAVVGLPEPAAAMLYLVSTLVREAASHRDDVLSPGELVRGANGQPIGCVGLVANQSRRWWSL